MNTTLRTLARRVGAVIADYNYAQHRVNLLQTNPDHYVFAPNHAPDSYEDFLFRTSGPLEHELSAAARCGKRDVR
jgi:hypothetical protein